jgi:hypothetical protein
LKWLQKGRSFGVALFNLAACNATFVGTLAPAQTVSPFGITYWKEHQRDQRDFDDRRALAARRNQRSRRRGNEAMGGKSAGLNARRQAFQISG